MTPPVAPTLRELVQERRILVCCGSGGVGKTTTAAVLGLEAARAGRRVVVVTIDPAKRLADALGLEGLTGTPSQIEGDWPGELWALMLDTKSTFDDLVAANAESPEQAQRIFENRFYRNISGALSGTQEYMAMEKLYELHARTDFDLVVVDTPPTRHALDFIDAPRRLSRFLDHRLFRMITLPRSRHRPGRERGHAGLPPHGGQGGGGGGHRRRRGVLPGLRGDGRRVPDAGRCGGPAALGRRHRLRAGGVARGATPSRRRSSSPPSWPRPTSGCRRSSSTACTPRSHRGWRPRRASGPPPSRALTSVVCTGTWPTSSSWPRARRSTWRAWRRPCIRPRSCGCRSCPPTCTTSPASPTWRATSL